MRLGLIINPFAGIGGPTGLKGSDGENTVQQALALGAEKRALERTRQTLQKLLPYQDKLKIFTWAGEMGGDVAQALGFDTVVMGASENTPINRIVSTRTTAADTENAARTLAALPVDLIIFVGGDGTARNMVNAVGTLLPVLGIPAGVKIHSGVYAVNPQGAAEILIRLLKGEWVSLADMEVRDIDENAFREGRVHARHYGELRVPVEGRYIQHVKCGGREVETLVLAEIAADIVEQLNDDTYYVVGPGTTTRAIMEALHQPNTLLGVDLLKGATCVGNDLNENDLWNLLHDQSFKIIVTAIGGQGHLFGRGNQQISPRLIRLAGKDNVWVVATRAKLTELQGRPLRLDTGDEALDKALSGYIRVTTGYQDYVLYELAE